MVRPRDDLDPELFGVVDWAGFRNLIGYATHSVKDENVEDCLRAALAYSADIDKETGDPLPEYPPPPGLKTFAPLLKDRREWIAGVLGISVRTAMRNEERGLREVVEIINEEIERRDPFEILRQMRFLLRNLTDIPSDVIPAAALEKCSAGIREASGAIADRFRILDPSEFHSFRELTDSPLSGESSARDA